MIITTSSYTATRARRAFLLSATASLTFTIFISAAQAAETHKEAKIDIAPGGTVNIVNGAGSVTLHSGNGRQVLATYIVHYNNKDKKSKNK